RELRLALLVVLARFHALGFFGVLRLLALARRSFGLSGSLRRSLGRRLFGICELRSRACRQEPSQEGRQHRVDASCPTHSPHGRPYASSNEVKSSKAKPELVHAPGPSSRLQTGFLVHKSFEAWTRPQKARCAPPYL